LPIDKIRTKFNELKDSRQTIVIIAIIMFLISIFICLITLAFRQLFGSRLSSRQARENIEYVMLQNVDDNDDDEPKSISTNGHKKQIQSTEITIPPNHIEET
jgi:hypothetical protein